MQLEHDTTRLGCEGSVEDPRRPTGVRGREELLTSLAVSVVAYNEIALDEVHLFPMVVHERLGGERAWRDPKQTTPAAGFIGFIQIAGQHFLVHAVGIPCGCFPIVIHFDGHEFNVWLAFWHVSPRRNTPDAAPGCKLKILLQESRTTGDDEPC